MAESNVIYALAKVLIAEAWADGAVTNQEINSLKDLLFQLPEMTANDWAQLDMYIESPVGEAERSRLVAQLQASLRTEEDRALVLRAIDAVMQADGEIPAAEQAVVEEIKDTILGTSGGEMGRLGRLMGRSVKRRSQMVENAPNRELYIDDFRKNKIYYSLSRRMELDRIHMDVPDVVLRKLSLAGGLMARVAFVDGVVTQGEKDAMLAAVRRYWELSEVEADLIVEAAVSEISRQFDYYRLSRQFFESTDEKERVRFMNILFAVADADGRVSYEEIEEIRTIANVLKLSHKQFIDAKLTIPRDRRPD